MTAAIFDMDGVLTDSEPLICAAATAMFAELGVKVQADDFRPFVGAGENRYIGGVAELHGVELDLPRAKARTYELYLEMAPGILRPFNGAVDLVSACRRAGWRTAVASSADSIKVQTNLSLIGLDVEGWDAVVWGEDVENGKPSPEIFLMAARRLGVEPVECVVIEDAVNGVKAARAAGMGCLAVAQTFDARLLREAHLVKPDIAQTGLADLKQVLEMV